MEEALLAFVVCASNAFCFALGARVGHASDKGEKVTPLITKAIKAKKEAKMEQDRLSIILQNIENYNGTPEGQKDVSGR